MLHCQSQEQLKAHKGWSWPSSQKGQGRLGRCVQTEERCAEAARECHASCSCGAISKFLQLRVSPSTLETPTRSPSRGDLLGHGKATLCEWDLGFGQFYRLQNQWSLPTPESCDKQGVIILCLLSKEV